MKQSYFFLLGRLKSQGWLQFLNIFLAICLQNIIGALLGGLK